MKSTPLVLVLALVAVALAIFLALPGDSGAPVPAANPGGAGAAAATAQPGAVTTSVGGPGGANAPEAAVATRTEVGTDTASGERLLARIRGRLVDPAGQPLAGERLRCGDWDEGMPPGFGGARDTDRARQDLVTRADGGFDFIVARDRAVLLELPADDAVFEDEPGPIRGSDGDRDLGALVVVPCATLAGVVQDERGRPVADVQVGAARGRIVLGARSTTTTGDDGRFRLGKIGAGSWTLRTASAHHLPATLEVAIERGASREDLVLVVAKGNGIAGQVIDDLGRPVAGSRVGAKRAEAHGGIDIERFAAGETTTTDDSGLFTLSGLEGETVTVRAYGGGHSSTVVADVPVGTGNLVLRVDRFGAVAGVLRAADGAPIANSRVTATTANRGEPGVRQFDWLLPDRSALAETGLDGSFRLDEVRPGPVTIRAEGEGHRPVQLVVDVRPGAAVENLNLIAKRGATAVVRVVDDNGAPVAHAKVRALEPATDQADGPVGVRARGVERSEGDVRVLGDNEPLATAETDAEGVARLGGLRDGPVRFAASHAEYAEAAPVTLPLLSNGTVEVKLTLRTPGWADLTVTKAGSGEPVAGARYRVRSTADGGEAKSGQVDAQGRALVGPLAPGSYVAELVRANEGLVLGEAMVFVGTGGDDAIAASKTRFLVTADTTTPVELRRPILTRVVGTVSGVDGPVADCRVQFAKDQPGRPALPGFGGGRTVNTAADGSFAIDDLEAGDYRVEYGHVAQLVKAETTLTVLPDVPEQRLDLALRTGKVRVQAWSATDDAPLANAEVTLRRPAPAGAGERRETRMVMVSMISTGNDAEAADGTMMTIGGNRAKTGADGQAEIEDVPVGNYDLEISHAKYAPATQQGIAITELTTFDVGRIVLNQAGRIRGKVLAADGGAVQMALVHHRPVGGSEGQPAMAMDGSFRLDALAPGRYLLQAAAVGLQPGGRGERGPEVEVEVKGGETATAELRLPAR